MLNAPIVATLISKDGTGYWDIGADGGVFEHNIQRITDSQGHFNAVGMLVPGDLVRTAALTPSGRGILMTTEAGRHYAFGDAPFKGND